MMWAIPVELDAHRGTRPGQKVHDVQTNRYGILPGYDKERFCMISDLTATAELAVKLPSFTMMVCECRRSADVSRLAVALTWWRCVMFCYALSYRGVAREGEAVRCPAAHHLATWRRGHVRQLSQRVWSCGCVGRRECGRGLSRLTRLAGERLSSQRQSL